MKITDFDASIYKQIPTEFDAARYHSWIASRKDFPEDLRVTAIDEAGDIMSLEHKEYAVSAVQYHPESILTPLGEQIVRNFIEAHI